MKYTILLTITATLSTALAQGTNAKKPFLKGTQYDCGYQSPETEECNGTKFWCETPDLRKIDGYKTFKECYDDHEPDPNKSTPQFPNGATQSQKLKMIQDLCSTHQFFGNKYDVSEEKCKEKLRECVDEERTKNQNPELNVIVECLDNKFS
ncbi:hypothetical protein MANI_009568 [Metarhizium anisopliae]|uniref:Extracellular membrane protein CFEM domain-containing protein n=2 Tax=Metarhizium TaxID=5529 RepID=A0A0D9P843_METAN